MLSQYTKKEGATTEGFLKEGEEVGGALGKEGRGGEGRGTQPCSTNTGLGAEKGGTDPRGDKLLYT